MTIYSLDKLLFLFGTSLSFHVQFWLLLPDLHIGLSRGRSGGLVFPSLSEFSTVYCDTHSQRLWHSQESRNRCFSGTLPFSMIHQILAIWSLIPLPFLKPAWTLGSSQFTYCWSLALRILSITLLAREMNAIVRLSIIICLSAFGVLWNTYSCFCPYCSKTFFFCLLWVIIL